MTAQAEKACTRCGVTQPLNNYPPDQSMKLGVQSWCKPCMRDYQTERRANATPKAKRDRKEQDRAYNAAISKLRFRHHREFIDLYHAELAERGLR